MCAPWGALREIGGRSSVIGRVCAAMCARWRGRWCVVGHSFGSAAVLTAAQAPRLRGATEAAYGRDGPKGLNFNLRRKATCLDPTTKSRATTQLGTLEELRTNARSDPTRRRERGPPIVRVEDRRATTARPLEAGHEDGVPGKRLHLWRKGHAEGRPMWAARPGSFPARRP